jgi:hypothetical protein
MSPQLPEAPSGTTALIESFRELSPKEKRKQAQEMTASQLDELVGTIESESTMPKVFEDASVRDALSKRLEEVEVTDETRSKWTTLQGTVDAVTDADPLKGKSFIQKLFAKGGINAIMAGMGASVLGFFGLKKLLGLGKGKDKKGMFGSGVEFAKNHPIITAILGAMGISVGSAAYKYIKGNEKTLVDKVKEDAAAKGLPEEEVATSLGEKLHGIVDDSTANMAKGIATILGGKFDDETGVVTLPGGALLRHPVITVYRAGKRLDMMEKRGVSKFVLQKRLDAILQQTRIVGAEGTTNAAAKKVLAKRATTLLAQGVLPNGATRQSTELDRILKTLSPDMKFKPSDLAEEIRLRPAETEAKLRTLEAEMHDLSKKEVVDFNKTKAKVSGIMSEAEGVLHRNEVNKHGGNVAAYKQSVLEKVRAATDEFDSNNNTKKLAVASQITDAMNSLSDVDGKGMSTLDAATKGRTAGVLDGTARRIEKAGMSIHKLPGGKLVTRSLIGLSLAPLALEGLAALSPGEKGKAAKEAFKNDLIETGGGFIPVVGEIMDFKAAFMGTDMNGRELTTAQRATAGAMGVLGSASIVLGFFTGGATVVGFRALRGAAATRKAVKLAKLANRGEQTMSAAKALKVAKAAEKNAEVLKNMSKTTKLQRRAQSARRFVRNGQRTVQVATYAHLGMQLTSGAVNLIGNVPGAVDSVRKKAHEGISATGDFVTGKTAE